MCRVKCGVLSEYTATERVARVTWRLARGQALTTQEVVKLTGLTPSGARRLLFRVGRVVPIYDDGQTWRGEMGEYDLDA